MVVVVIIICGSTGIEPGKSEATTPTTVAVAISTSVAIATPQQKGGTFHFKRRNRQQIGNGQWSCGGITLRCLRGRSILSEIGIAVVVDVVTVYGISSCGKEWCG